MLVSELRRVRFGGRDCVSCGRRNTLEASQGCRVVCGWQAQHLVQVAFQISWPAQHFVTCGKCRCDESPCQGCVNVSKVSNFVAGAELCDVSLTLA
eukprot:s119_g61.t1